MCGIVGIVSHKNVTTRLVESLKKLEYRGYDSSGVAIVEKGTLTRRRAVGKIVNLERELVQNPLEGTTGIGHTRWATHGAPSKENAHPHKTEHVALVHNGIIENYGMIKSELQERGHVFTSDTDTEVIAHLISSLLGRGLSPLEATFAAIKKLEGAYAICVLFHGFDRMMICARRGSPMAIGHGEEEVFVASDAIALAPFTNKVTYLHEGDFALIHKTKVTYYNAAEEEVERPIQIQAIELSHTEKGHFNHFMEKEIFEQPQVVHNILDDYLDQNDIRTKLPLNNNLLLPISHLTIVACGTSYFAGHVAKYWFEALTGIPTNIDIASEFRYRNPPLSSGGLAIFISQSGETADTLAAMRHAKAQGQVTLALVNVAGSSLARESDLMLQLKAGPEIGVASTKAFAAQLTVLLCFAIHLARVKSKITPSEEEAYCHQLLAIPSLMREALQGHDHIKTVARQVYEARSMLYIGRNHHFPLALEGALKMKEISYIHAEAYAGGELKHGPIALIDEHMPIIALAPQNDLFDKMISNIQEVVARKGQVILISDAEEEVFKDLSYKAYVQVPSAHPLFEPLLTMIPLQLLAYETAVLRGSDVDQPRNLAKSVTVE